jgi:hypothetical protein
MESAVAVGAAAHVVRLGIVDSAELGGLGVPGAAWVVAGPVAETGELGRLPPVAVVGVELR